MKQGIRVLAFSTLLISLLSLQARAALIGEWSFNTGFTDISGSGHNLSSIGSVTLQPGIVGSAASFDGSGFLYSSNPSLTGTFSAFSMGAFIKAIGNPGPDAIIMGNFFGCPTGFCAGLTDHFGAAYAYVGSGTSNAHDTGAELNNGEWHHIAQTFDGTTIRLYVDGVETASAVSTYTHSLAASEFSMGGRSILDQTFTGLMDEAFFADHVMSSAEIAGFASAATIPIPTAVWLFGSALGILGWIRHRKPA